MNRISIKGGGSITGPKTLEAFINKIVVPTIKKSSDDFLFNLADKTAKGIQDKLRRQMYDHVPLAASTVEQKQANRQDPRILIRTKTYLNNIGVQDVEVKKGIAYGVGVPREKKEPEGVPLSLIMRVHEYGNSYTPARPVYRPTVLDLKMRASTLSKDFVKRLDKDIKVAITRNKQLIDKVRI